MRAVVLVMCLAVDAIAAPPTVGVDVSRLEGADTSAMAQALVARLVQEGFAVVQPAADPMIVLTVTARQGELVVTAKAEHFDRSRTIAASAGGSQVQLELVQKAVELARLAVESIPPPPEPLAIDTVAAPPPRETRWRVGIDGGVLGRSGGVDPELAVHAGASIWRGLGAALVVAGTSSSDNDVAVRELYALAGIGGDWALAPRLRAEAVLVGGLREHHFATAMPIAEPTGDRVDPALALRARIGYQPLSVLELSLWAGATLSEARTHLLGTDVLWRRGAAGIGGGLGAALRF